LRLSNDANIHQIEIINKRKPGKIIKNIINILQTFVDIKIFLFNRPSSMPFYEINAESRKSKKK